ncbi:MAG: hypothetical protein IJJ51_02795 [Kiritimatiellae bacterium]|nr:hypothetical protein [Kiritimatiellia bacterium]
MADSVQIAVYEGGELVVHEGGEKTREAVLALPLGRLLVKIARVPAVERGEAAAVVEPLLKAASPYPDEPLTVGVETQRETAEGAVVLAAALPEEASEDIGEALDGARLNVTRIDALVLGVLRERLAEIAPAQSLSPDAGGEARRLVLVAERDDVAIAVLDGGTPVELRAVASGADLRREAMLSLLAAEDFGGEKPLAEVVVLGEVDTASLEAFAPVRRLETEPETAEAPRYPRGIAERSLEAGALNALPESWRIMLEETRFKAKMVKALAVAGAIWALAMGVLFGVPLGYGFMTDRQKAMSREHSRRYNEVREMREKVRLVQKYSDHARGALEILKAVSDRLPEGVELNNWNFRRDEGVRFSGEAADAGAVYKLKDALIDMRLDVAGEAAGEGGGESGGEEGESEAEGERVFADVELIGPSAGKGGRQRFDIECKYVSDEEEG